jgi:glutamate synthase (NADPH/NADH) small chain
LEKTIVARRVDLLAKRGVEFRLGVRVGWEVSLDDLMRDYEAVFLGVGAQQTKPLDVPGAQLGGVIQALSFLMQNSGECWLGPGDPAEVVGKRVVVLGGGDTAMDCLRTAVRSDAKSATCLYRRDLANMPGSRKEYANALEEGAVFQFLASPVELTATPDGKVSGVRCVQMALGEPDASGRRKPRAVPNSEFLVPADLVLIAYGFDPMPFPEGSDFRRVATNDWGGIIVDENQMTSVPGVFAGGDSSRGPSLVVHAVRDARKAAAAIHRRVSVGAAV